MTTGTITLSDRGSMPERTITVGRFQAECLSLLHEVAATGTTIVVTKAGRPLVRVVPVEGPSSLGGVAYNPTEDELLRAPPDEWDAEDE